MGKEQKTVWACRNGDCLNVQEDESDVCEMCGSLVDEVERTELFD